MAVPVSGSVTLNGTQAVMVLDVRGQNAPTAATLTFPCFRKYLTEVPIHRESRLPVIKKQMMRLVHGRVLAGHISGANKMGNHVCVRAFLLRL